MLGDAVARTDRLILRSGHPHDAEELTAAIAHWEVARMLERLPWPYTVEDGRWWLSATKTNQRPEPLITLLETGAIVGGVGLIQKDEVELGYWLTPAAWGQGYATEAALAMVAFGRDSLGLTHIASGHFIDNPASERVLAKAGFRPNGVKGTRHCLALGKNLPFVEFKWSA